MVEAAVEARVRQLHLESLDDVGRPGSGLLEVVHGDHGPLHQDAHLITELTAEDLVQPTRLHRRFDHLGLPDGGLRLGHAAQALTLGADDLLHSCRPKLGRHGGQSSAGRHGPYLVSIRRRRMPYPGEAWIPSWSFARSKVTRRPSRASPSPSEAA